jgi:glycerol-3-phosphate dehydrogenase (NAD(P)+)
MEQTAFGLLDSHSCAGHLQASLEYHTTAQRHGKPIFKKILLTNIGQNLINNNFLIIMKSAAIIGSGSFGTALAFLLGQKVERITLIGRDPAIAAAINEQHRNPRYLSEAHLSENVHASANLADAVAHPLIVFAVPTSATRSTACDLAKIGTDAAIVSSAKGMERNTGDRMSQILREIFPDNPLAVISGPNHAEEIAHNMATCAVIGSHNEELAASLQKLFTLPHFRTYTSTDIAGIELGGAIKNIYAIAAGIAAGLGLGDNAIAALVTRALSEMTRLGVALGGQRETFTGLSGVGDLIATCFSPHSRNHRVGLALGQGKALDEALASIGMIAEGVPNTLSIFEAARVAQINTPIIDAVHSILYQNRPAALALRDLLTRDPRPEAD